jgi:predicted HAD superfamily phosphohydrolase
MDRKALKVTDALGEFAVIVNGVAMCQNEADARVISNRLNSFCTARRLVVPLSGD